MISPKPKFRILRSVIACLVFLTFVDTASAIQSANDIAPQVPKEPIVVNGDNVEYFHEKKMVTGTGNVSIEYKDIKLTCDKITVYLDTRESVAEGNVRVTQKGAYFTGERMNYNFDTKKGTVIKGYLNAKPFYGKADDVEKLAVKDQFNMSRGYVTTCDLDNPHYRLQAKRVEIYLNDKVVAKHLVFYIKNMPVAYLPYYVQPLKDKKSHITVIPGQSKDWGYYALTSYRYYLDDKNRGDILLDYRSKRGLAEGVNHYYDLGDIGNGAFKFYYTHENDILAYEKMGPVRNRYRWQGRHEWELPEGTDTNMLLEFNKMSDADMIKDFIYNEYEELGANPDNYLTFITQKEFFSTQFLVRKRFDKFLNVVERLPEFSIDIPDNNILKNTAIYYRANASAAYLNQTYDNTNMPTSQKDVASGRIDAYNRLSYAARFFRSLAITPYAAVESTYYSKTNTDQTNLVRNAFSFGVDNSVKLYKIYDVTTNFLDLNINKLRHIITPTVNYYYVHRPTVTPDKLYQFDSIDALARANGFAFGLENRLQTKRGDFEGNMNSVDLATLRISTNYDFILKQNSFEAKYDKFSNILFDLELIPYDWAYMKSQMSIDTKHYWVQNYNIDLVAHWKDKWSLAVSDRYERTDLLKDNNLVTLDATYRVNDKWKLRAYERFNSTVGSLEEQEYTIIRDLHCWLLEFTFNSQVGGNDSIWLVFKLKAFPETPIGLKRTYSRPRFGEAGAPPQ